MEKLTFSVSRLHKPDGTGATKAFVDVVVNDELDIKGFRVIEGKDGLFAAMPRECGKDGKWYNSVCPLKRETKDRIEALILEAYTG